MLLTSWVWARAISLAFYKRNKKLHSCALSSYISTWEFLRILEKCEKHLAAPRVSLCTFLVFLKIPACLNNSTMHSDAFFISLVNCILSCFPVVHENKNVLCKIRANITNNYFPSFLLVCTLCFQNKRVKSHRYYLCSFIMFPLSPTNTGSDWPAVPSPLKYQH